MFDQTFHNLGLPTLSSYAATWLVLIGLTLTLLLLLLIILFKPFRRTAVVEHSNVSRHVNLAAEFEAVARENKDEELMAVIQSLQIARATNTIPEYFFTIFTYMDRVVAPKFPEVKKQTEAFKAEILKNPEDKTPILVTSQFNIKESND